jgi:hypothetical protein
MMMTPLDFYASITPDCSLHSGVGAGRRVCTDPQVGSGVHVELHDKELGQGDYYWGRSSAEGSVLNR